MGVVYLVEDLRLKRRVVLKVLSPELAEDERFQERLLTESEQVVGLPSHLTHGLGSPYALRDTRRRARGKRSLRGAAARERRCARRASWVVAQKKRERLQDLFPPTRGKQADPLTSDRDPCEHGLADRALEDVPSLSRGTLVERADEQELRRRCKSDRVSGNAGQVCLRR